MSKTFKSFQELFDYCSTEGLSSGVNQQSELKFSSARKIQFLPISRRSGTQMECLRIVTPEGTGPALQAIAFHMLFGRRTRTYFIWYLFNYLLTQKKYTERGQALFNLLMTFNFYSASARRVVNNWNYVFPPLRKILGEKDELFQILVKELEWLLPKNKLMDKKTTESRLLAEKVFIRFRKSPDPARIGIGYKDKGNLPQPGSEYDPSEITPYSEPDQYKCWNKFMEGWKKFKCQFHKRN